MPRNPAQFFEMANNGGGEWRENDWVAFNLSWELFHSNRSTADSLHRWFSKSYLVSPSANPAVQTKSLSKVYWISNVKRRSTEEPFTVFNKRIFLTNDQSKPKTFIFCGQLPSAGVPSVYLSWRQTRAVAAPAALFFISSIFSFVQRKDGTALTNSSPHSKCQAFMIKERSVLENEFATPYPLYW